MAVPGTAYNNKKLKGTDKFAYRLLEYSGNEKTLFYLDALLVHNESGLPFVGLVKLNSANYKMHSLARISDFRVKIGSDVYLALSDGGLNTKAFANTPTSSIHRIGNTQVSSLILNAYYVASTIAKVQYKKVDTTWVDWISDTPIGTENTSETVTITGEEFNGYVAGDTVYVRFVIVNSEGGYTTADINFELGLMMLNLKYNASTASVANSGSTYKDVYFDNAVIFESATRWFRSDTLPLTQLESADEGYYISGGYWYKVEDADIDGNPTPGIGNYHRVTDFGLAVDGKWPSGDPANPATYSEVVFSAYSYISYADSCDATDSPFTYYKRAFDGKLYTTTGLTTLAADGYYIRSLSGTKKWFQYEDGLQILAGVCLEPE